MPVGDENDVVMFLTFVIAPLARVSDGVVITAIVVLKTSFL